MRVLLLCTNKTAYVVQLYNFVKKYYPSVKYSILTTEDSADYYKDNLQLECEENIFSVAGPKVLAIGLAISRLPKFDIIHSMWLEYFWGLFACTIRTKTNKWFASIGGSDLYRDTKHWYFRCLQRRILSRCDLISSEGESTRAFFNATYRNKYGGVPHRIIRYGVDILDEIVTLDNNLASIKELRAKYSIPGDKIVVMCGTCGRVQHQHIRVLEAMEKLPCDIINRICILIPATYDVKEDYIERVENKARSITDSVVVLREYLSPRGMAEIAYITDIMIHVQTTDQLSSAMISHMFIGNVVIAGSWLPYDELREKGIGFISIDNIEELSKTIPSVIETLDGYRSSYSNNKNIIYEISSWERSARDWYAAYTFLVNK